MSQESVSDAIDYFHELLDGGFLDSTREILARETKARDLRFLKRDLVTVLRPVFVSAATYRSAMRAATIVSRALTRLHRKLARDARLRAELSLSEDDERFVRAEPDGPTESWARIDGFLGEDGDIRFLEFNSMAAGVADHDEIAGTFLSMPIMEAFQARFPIHCETTQSRTIESFLRAFKNRGGVGIPSLAIVSDPNADRELQWLEARIILGRLASLGAKIQRVLAQDIECRGGRVMAGGAPVDVVITDDWPAFLRAVPFEAPFWSAVRAGSVWLGKSWSLRLLRGDKRQLAMMTDPRFSAMFDEEERRAIARHVPWTRVIAEGRAERRGETIDLVDFVRENRDRLVIKPANDYGGAGVVLGWEADDAAWEQAIRRALEERPHVVQERAPAIREVFPSIADGALRYEERTIDFNPFVWNESTACGVASRLSRSSLMNLTAGGGSHAPVFVLRG